ncbi:heme biosynthesis protein HemY [Pseudomonas flexibilis]|uniref:Heme biosynthesis protein HemY n=1 Tax=Pseudomonas flexibilis TaxID=706570 RepID=A0A0B3BWY0_9PSED|nr:heme biosynthesis HemY N-terminal domain-containing protein [Pseudomonas flexibilis]KHO63922.1 heme biosynthesis protein HemY [Pseudomonas flexibilis]SCY22974.1 HemY protein [Pseudomonas flexibilis]
MIRAVLLLAVLVAGASLLGLAIAQGSGYVLIAYRGMRYESSLWMFLALLLALWLLVWLARRALRLLGVSGALLNPWSRRHRQRRGHKASERGLLELAEGRWRPALQHLRLAAEQDPHPLPYYLAAARAAQHLGDYEESDALLEQALNRQPHAELVIALTHAELQEQRGNLEGAEETLTAMLERHPHQPEALRRLLAVQRRQAKPAALLGLLPELRKHKVIEEAELRELEREAWAARLSEVGRGGEAQALRDTWPLLSSSLQHDSHLLGLYAEQLGRAGAEAEAEALVRKALRRQYQPALVELYGRLRGADSGQQLQEAEQWLKEHPDDPVLLRALARISIRHQLWGKARDYYDASLALQRDPRTCAELARLLARLGEGERSNQLFQEGLGMLDTDARHA